MAYCEKQKMKLIWHCLLINRNEQEQEKILNDMDFYHLQGNIKNNYWIQNYMLPKK